MIRELVRQNQQSAMSPRTIGNGRFQRRAVRSAPEPMGEHNARGFQKQGYEISTYCSFLDIPLLAETNPAIQRTESNYSVYQSIQEGTADPTTTKTALNPCFQLPDSFQHIAKSEWIPKVPLTELRGDSWTIQLMEQRRQTKATVTRLKELAEFLIS
ncbi:MAG: hypothetical protein HC936_07460 [Leptolyngbyaceae cyanobacterium SU_3_3]|nr:hypothetical protein [Leptolyngbyaceae cyanobacterium SU_3_3]